jgi:glutamate-1-semialdehyde aminotransferase
LPTVLASINALEYSRVYDHADKQSSIVREEMNGIFEDEGFTTHAVSAGSVFCLHLTNKKPQGTSERCHML